jgi:hypothetical protein
MLRAPCPVVSTGQIIGLQEFASYGLFDLLSAQSCQLPAASGSAAGHCGRASLYTKLSDAQQSPHFSLQSTCRAWRGILDLQRRLPTATNSGMFLL